VSETKAPTALDVFKERQGPASEELLEYVKATNKRKAAVKKALKDGPMTVPEVAEAIGFEAKDVLWTLTAMRKYGQAVEDGVDGDYPRYALPEKEVKR
jgi:predicted transcriptional regulator